MTPPANTQHLLLIGRDRAVTMATGDQDRVTQCWCEEALRTPKHVTQHCEHARGGGPDTHALHRPAVSPRVTEAPEVNNNNNNNNDACGYITAATPGSPVPDVERAPPQTEAHFKNKRCCCCCFGDGAEPNWRFQRDVSRQRALSSRQPAHTWTRPQQIWVSAARGSRGPRGGTRRIAQRAGATGPARANHRRAPRKHVARTRAPLSQWEARTHGRTWPGYAAHVRTARGT